MRILDDLEIGVMFWAEPPAAAAIRRAKAAGLRCGQLGIPPEMRLEGAAGEWRQALEAEDFTLVTVFAAFSGESYADIPTVRRTVGFVPPESRAARLARMLEVSDFAAELGAGSIACHIGCIPEDPDEPDYFEVVDVVRRIADHAGRRGQTFALETGQESARVLLRFIQDVARANLRVNFDPANMVLYGAGDPVEAFRLLAPYVVSVHAKDGDWPPSERPGALGQERPLGEGAVGIERFVKALREAGYRGTLNIEREIDDPEQKWRDIAAAARLLRSLVLSR